MAYAPYHDLKAAALEELRKALPTVSLLASRSGDVLAELKAAGYEWAPGLGLLEQELPPETPGLARFLLGGLIFGAYAQRLGGEHLMLPQRSRLFLAVSLGVESADTQLEDSLFESLKQFSNIKSDNIPWQPTFLPYLLHKAETPMGMLEEVAAMRKSGEVKDYRNWYTELMDDWTRNGRISNKTRADVEKIATAVRREVQHESVLPTVELKITVADALEQKPPGKLDLTPPLRAAWGWLLASIPGHRYRKLLTRAILADFEL